jgi:hypothetical protein
MRRGEVFDRLAELTRRQLGLVTRAQAGRVGVPDRELLRYLCARDLERVAHGVYRFRRDLDDLHQPLWAAWLQLDPARTAAERVAGPGVPDAIVSHESAADIYWIGNLYADIHTFTVSEPRTSGRRDVRLVASGRSSTACRSHGPSGSWPTCSPTEGTAATWPASPSTPSARGR